jgi:hypothetical protein
MMAPNGIKASFDDDFTHSFKIPAKSAIHAAAASFDPLVLRRILWSFNTGSHGFDHLLDALAGQTVTETRKAIPRPSTPTSSPGAASVARPRAASIRPTTTTSARWTRTCERPTTRRASSRA